MPSIHDVKQTVERIGDSVEATIDHDVRGTIVTVRSDEDIIPELESLAQEHDLTFKPEGRYFGKYEYVIK